MVVFLCSVYDDFQLKEVFNFLVHVAVQTFQAQSSVLIRNGGFGPQQRYSTLTWQWKYSGYAPVKPAPSRTVGDGCHNSWLLAGSLTTRCKRRKQLGPWNREPKDKGLLIKHGPTDHAWRLTSDVHCMFLGHLKAAVCFLFRQLPFEDRRNEAFVLPSHLHIDINRRFIFFERDMYCGIQSYFPMILNFTYLGGLQETLTWFRWAHHLPTGYDFLTQCTMGISCTRAEMIPCCKDITHVMLFDKGGAFSSFHADGPFFKGFHVFQVEPKCISCVHEKAPLLLRKNLHSSRHEKAFYMDSFSADFKGRGSPHVFFSSKDSPCLAMGLLQKTFPPDIRYFLKYLTLMSIVTSTGQRCTSLESSTQGDLKEMGHIHTKSIFLASDLEQRRIGDCPEVLHLVRKTLMQHASSFNDSDGISRGMLHATPMPKATLGPTVHAFLSIGPSQGSIVHFKHDMSSLLERKLNVSTLPKRSSRDLRSSSRTHGPCLHEKGHLQGTYGPCLRFHLCRLSSRYMHYPDDIGIVNFRTITKREGKVQDAFQLRQDQKACFLFPPFQRLMKDLWSMFFPNGALRFDLLLLAFLLKYGSAQSTFL